MPDMNTPETVEISLPEGVSIDDIRRALAGEKHTEKSDKDLVIFAELPKGNENVLRVYRDIFTDKRGKRHETLSVREFYRNDYDELTPGKGATFKYEMLDELIYGLQQMKEWLENHPEEEV